MKLTIHLEGKTKEELAKQLAEHMALLSGTTAKAEKAPAAKKGKAKDDDEDESEEDEEDSEENEKYESEEDEEDSEDESEDSEEDEDGEEDEDESVSLEDVLAACQKYAKKHGRAAVPVVLKKFKVESARDLKPVQFEKVLKALKVKP